jgi:hypothetical protein
MAKKEFDFTRAFAEMVARDLFTDGPDRRGRRLVMEYADGPKLNGGGYCEAAVADLIERHLREAEKGASKARKKPRPR